MFLANLFKHLTYQAFSPGTLLRHRYEAFKEILSSNKDSLELIADLETIYHDGIRADFCQIEKKCEELSRSVARIVENLNRMSPVAYVKLGDYFKKIDFYIRYHLATMEYDISPPFMLHLDEIPSEGERLAGGKAYRLGRIGRETGVAVPEGFVITSNAFNYFCEYNDLRKEIADRLSTLDIYSPSSLDETARDLQALIGDAALPSALEDSLSEGFSLLERKCGEACRVAVRSSAVGEDSLLSFAGQYLTVLNVSGPGLQDAYKRVIASKFSPGALFYRISNGVPDIETPMAVLVVRMIDARASGVLYTSDPVSTLSDRMVICSVWGLGEPLVSGATTPDLIEVSRKGTPRVLRREKGNHVSKVVISPGSGISEAPLEASEKRDFSLDDNQAGQLATWSLQLEAFFGQFIDVEWCLDHRGNLYILQARPLRVEPASGSIDVYPAKSVPNRLLLSGGERAASGVGVGRVVKVAPGADLSRIAPQSVLVTDCVSPGCVRIIDRLCAAVVDAGSIAGHFSSIARECGVPTIVNAKGATEILKEGETVTVDANRCLVFEGSAEGLLADACRKPDAFKESPLLRRLRAVLNHISPLHLTDPLSPGFAPEGCKSFHDIIRFAHEKAMHEMFSIGRKGSKAQKGAKRLVTNLPIILYVVDIGQGTCKDTSARKEVRLKDIENPLLKAVWRGLSHREIHWSPELLHIDWAELERLSAGGIFSVDSPLLASFAVISRDYLNLSIRFGYHFAVVDSFCGPESEENYIMFNFKGGGSAYHGIMLRVKFLVRILESLGFTMTLRGDLVEAQLKHVSPASVEEKLEIIGCLLGCTRLMDYVLKDDHVVELLADQFLRGDYRFGHLQKRPAPGKE